MRKTQNDRNYIGLNYDLQVQFGARRGVLCFLYVVNGVELACTSVSFDGQEGEEEALAGFEGTSRSCVIQ
jgi:hypothetical protein